MKHRDRAALKIARRTAYDENLLPASLPSAKKKSKWLDKVYKSCSTKVKWKPHRHIRVAAPVIYFIQRKSSFEGTCFRCGECNNLTRHHFPPARLLRELNYKRLPSFIIPVCDKCHNILDIETHGPRLFNKQYNWIVEKLNEMGERTSVKRGLRGSDGK